MNWGLQSALRRLDEIVTQLVKGVGDGEAPRHRRNLRPVPPILAVYARLKKILYLFALAHCLVFPFAAYYTKSRCDDFA